MNYLNQIKLGLISITLLILSAACDPGTVVTHATNPATCEGCHTNEIALKRLIQDEDVAPPSGGG
ncbi:MAG: hypothetical protein HOB40_04200 [Candidatus Marinimicrobia bacterium]|jgi:hypothetical protein|nr:hypothetical protein [Candidatus Neomarinimicrobiota bacterium]MBT7556811.1 hypothetical protein [Candidatus Woesearchaeota archaeon]MBT3998490.1 hypothetical protein [Candidatus Neomarinimicrobiota bacterium]MBT4957562.1 hypothetical protein [Candidatus Neomarinimicrobiota bacterium]MBT5777761.1 hypothetical protein [Candidatus Neomarinimicrobiota bacterium]